jgi:hypothetical protein
MPGQEVLGPTGRCVGDLGAGTARHAIVNDWTTALNSLHFT